ncbi:MAPEG family protein [Sphingomonas naphthae]|uniref:MAPEG family protein n=2 Tax=Sphingomonas naphthae TaxID=1813468 RepID=A0ABY7TQB7_9SPHN|nr:MAPEG family protein [Sphingomonas naphthae]WCT75437.1 MAPEG family protein [Sphingomonas naphthae]
MRIELTLLGATLVLALVNIFAAGRARTAQYGTKWNVGARDGEMPPLNPLAGRLSRAQANLYETLPIFAAAILACAVAGRFDMKTVIGAHLYFFGRLIYLPLYAAGVPVVRTLVWTIATFGLVLILWALLFG